MDVVPLAATTGTGGVPAVIGIPLIVILAGFVIWYRFFRKR